MGKVETIFPPLRIPRKLKTFKTEHTLKLRIILTVVQDEYFLEYKS